MGDPFLEFCLDFQIQVYPVRKLLSNVRLWAADSGQKEHGDEKEKQSAQDPRQKQPVYLYNRLACVIYLGNLLDKKQKETVIKKIKKNAPTTGVRPQELLDELKAMNP